MKILFVYSVTKSINRRTPLRGQEDIYFGISYISSLLKQNNNFTQIVVLDKRYTGKNYLTVDSEIESFNPDIICFTSVFSEFEFINVIAKYIRSKYPGILRIVGGVHVSINPDEKYLGIYDAICIGEGEFPVLELVTKMQSNDYYYDIPNFWFKKDSKIIKNPPHPFIENLSELPFPDREMWQKWILEPDSRITILLGRGCPFNCTYCCNHKIKEITGGKYVRLREVKDILNELSDITQRFPSVNEFFLEIETCGLNPDWLVNLCEELYVFNCKFNLPKSFSTNLRVFPGIKDELIFQSLKKANFSSVSVGLESGNERVRREILNREYSNDDIRRVVTTARKYGIKIMLYNIIGLPGETYNDFLDTLSLNQELQPDRHSTSVFFPYPGTDLYEKARKMGLIPENIDFSSERQKAVLDLPGFRKRQIQQSFDSFHFNVYKKAGKINLFKLTIYFVQMFTGHNFLTYQKLNIIRFAAFIKGWLT
jgi:anaerobic magnesium-protoporphyrin IX monomethyl ester cyclase